MWHRNLITTVYTKRRESGTKNREMSSGFKLTVGKNRREIHKIRRDFNYKSGKIVGKYSLKVGSQELKVGKVVGKIKLSRQLVNPDVFPVF